MVIEMGMEVNCGKFDESYKEERLNYKKVDVQKLKKYFENIN